MSARLSIKGATISESEVKDSFFRTLWHRMAGGEKGDANQGPSAASTAPDVSSSADATSSRPEPGAVAEPVTPADAAATQGPASSEPVAPQPVTEPANPEAPAPEAPSAVSVPVAEAAPPVEPAEAAPAPQPFFEKWFGSCKLQCDMGRFFIPLAIQAASQSLTYPLVASIISHGRLGTLEFAAFAQGQALMFLLGAIGRGSIPTGMVFARSRPAGFVALASPQAAIPPSKKSLFETLVGTVVEVSEGGCSVRLNFLNSSRG